MRSKFNKQSNKFVKNISGQLDNYIIWGPSGTGKSSSVVLLYPNCYKKQKGTQYWDGYDVENPDHKVVWIDEMSKETLATLTGKVDGGFEFLKELGDRYPVTVDEKYQVAFKIRPQTLIITMNEHPTSLLPDRAVEVNKAALYRKFKILHVSDWLLYKGLTCTPQGARYMYTSELDDIVIFKSDKEVEGEKEFNECVRSEHERTNRKKRCFEESDQRHQGVQETTNGSRS